LKFGDILKAQVLTGIDAMGPADVASPKIVNETDVLVKVLEVGVCGSDVHYYETGRIGSQIVEYPYMVGHECAGVVEAVGKSVTSVKVGDEVVIDPATACHKCDQCLAGRENTCRELTFLGCPGQAEGCLCEYIVMDEVSCFPTNGEITLEQGTLCEPFAIGVYAVLQANLPKDAKIAILGAGPIGLSCMAAAKAEGITDIYMTDKIAERVDIAAANGAVWAGNPDAEDIVKAIYEKETGGMDVVFECAGQQDAIDQGMELLKPGGKIMAIGIPREDRISYDADQSRRKEITVVNIRRQNDCTQKAIDLIATGKADVDFMVTHRFDFSQSKEAFDLVAGYKDGVVKAIIKL
jgi:L-iditol 2-dehydrogenase